MTQYDNFQYKIEHQTVRQIAYNHVSRILFSIDGRKEVKDKKKWVDREDADA